MWNKQILERAAGWREKAGIFLLKKFWTAGLPKNFRQGDRGYPAARPPSGRPGPGKSCDHLVSTIIARSLTAIDHPSRCHQHRSRWPRPALERHRPLSTCRRLWTAMPRKGHVFHSRPVPRMARHLDVPMCRGGGTGISRFQGSTRSTTCRRFWITRRLATAAGDRQATTCMSCDGTHRGVRSLFAYPSCLAPR